MEREQWKFLIDRCRRKGRGDKVHRVLYWHCKSRVARDSWGVHDCYAYQHLPNMYLLCPACCFLRYCHLQNARNALNFTTSSAVIGEAAEGIGTILCISNWEHRKKKVHAHACTRVLSNVYSMNVSLIYLDIRTFFELSFLYYDNCPLLLTHTTYTKDLFSMNLCNYYHTVHAQQIHTRY